MHCLSWGDAGLALSSQRAAVRGCSPATITAATAAALAEKWHKTKGLGKGEYSSCPKQIWSHLTSLFPSSGATTFVHAWGKMSKVCWWEGKCRTERCSKIMRPVSWTVQWLCFQCTGGDSCWPLMVFVEHWYVSSLEVVVTWAESCQLGKQANGDTQLPNHRI